MAHIVPGRPWRGRTRSRRIPRVKSGSISDHSNMKSRAVRWVKTTPLGLADVPLVKTTRRGDEASTSRRNGE
jgi:hypothetical protein